MRYAARADKNQPEILDAATKIGATYELIRSVHGGCPDALIGFQGRNYLWEIKVPKEGRLSEIQKVWRDDWSGGKPFVIKTVDDVILWAGLVSCLPDQKRKVIG
jgi:hypothetical protein